MVTITPVYGWGWTRLSSSTAASEHVEELTSAIHLSKGLLYADDDEAKMLSIALVGPAAKFGENGLVFPSADDPIRVQDGKFEMAVLIFGKVPLANSIEDAIDRAKNRLPQFEYPQIIGFAFPVEFCVSTAL